MQSGSGMDLTGLTYYLKDVLLNPDLSGLVGALAVVAAVGIRSGLRDRGLVIGWVILFFLFLQYGSSDLRHYNRVPQQARYVEPILVGLCVPLGVLLRRLGEPDLLRRAGLAVLLGFIAVQGMIQARTRMMHQVYWEAMPASVLHALSARRAESDTIIVADWTRIYLTPGIRSGVHQIDSAAVCRVLESAPPANTGTVVVLPERRGPGHACTIAPGWQVTAIREPVTFGDRALARLPWRVLSSRASVRVMGAVARPAGTDAP